MKRNLINGLLRLLPDDLYVCLLYFKHLHCLPNLKNPKTFSEKIQWLKLHDRKSEYTNMVDKIKVKDYVAKLVGDEYIVPTLKTYYHVDEIKIEQLPNQFVIKWNHDSGSIVICRDKSVFDWEKEKQKLYSGEKRKGYWYGREWPYKNVKPMLLAEKFLEIADSKDLRDYKFFCFHGVPKFCQVISDRNTDEKIDFYDMEWNCLTGLVGLSPTAHNSEELIPCPFSLEQMKDIARKLSKGIPFVRIDFYEVNGRPYFGEITFYPASGFGKFRPDEWNLRMGEMIDLDK